MKEIEITQGFVALVDDEDFEHLSKYSWSVHAHGYTFYARTSITVGSGKQRTVRMHRMILGCTDKTKVDHKDGNGLNNTRENLRIATYAENNRNSRIRKDNKTGFKGVIRRGARRFQAIIRVDKIRKHLGCFNTPEEAHRAYCEAAKQYFGAFARFK